MTTQPQDLARSLDEPLRRRLASGDHEAVAAELAAAGRHREAGWVLEQIWAFAGATGHYVNAESWLDALRTAIEERRPDLLDGVIEQIATLAPDRLAEAAALLERRGLHASAAQLLASASAGPERQAEALLRSGDRLRAAMLLADAGHARRALAALGQLPMDGGNADEHALAARLRWDLGDSEGTARHAQAARRAGDLEGERGRRVRTLLARALSSLGHDLAGQLVLGDGDIDSRDRTPLELAPHGRYRVTGVLPAAYAGAAYVGIDRVTLQEVEIHLLLADYAEQDKPAVELQQALERFAALASTADSLGHPAIRPILRLEAREGLLVMPRREGPLLRSLIRPPGLEQASPRARSVVAFMLDGLATAHAAGLVHGSLLPSQIACDSLGRPLLGAFGAHQLAGLVATRTGGLEEVLAITPPEQRSGGPATPAGDVYMLGALWAALLAGHFVDRLDSLPGHESNPLLVAMMAERPELRPTARAALAQLQTPVEDLSELARSSGPSPEESIRAATIDPRLGKAITVVAHEQWSDALLDALCLCRDPWLQNILDREGRTFQLAAWPEGCRTLAPGEDWRSRLDPGAFELLRPSGEPNELGELNVASDPAEAIDVDQALREAVGTRLDRLHARGESALVVTPAGEFMLALDRLLAS